MTVMNSNTPCARCWMPQRSVQGSTKRWIGQGVLLIILFCIIDTTYNTNR
jgi:hypothetical protein